jgi:hypothetical protein
MCTSREAVIEENGNTADIGRWEGCGLDGNVQIPQTYF